MGALLQAGVQVNRWTVPGQHKSRSLFKAVAKSLLIEYKGDHSQPSTPLHYACSLGHYYSAILLVKHGAWVNAALEDSMTPLIIAVQSQKVHLVTLLLDNGAKVNAATAKACLTPLHFSCRTGNLEMTQLLVSRGANTKALTVNVPPRDAGIVWSQGRSKQRGGCQLRPEHHPRPSFAHCSFHPFVQTEYNSQ